MKTQLITLITIFSLFLIVGCTKTVGLSEDVGVIEASEPVAAPVTETQGDEKGVSAGGEAASVVIKSFKFIPAELKVKKGTTVTWRNEDTAAHTVESSTADNKVLKSDELSPDDTFTFTFDQIGEFPYLCGIHRSMRAKVIVE